MLGNIAFGPLTRPLSACANYLCSQYGCQGHCGFVRAADREAQERAREEFIQQMQRRVAEHAQRQLAESAVPEFITISGKRYKLVPVE